MVQQRNRPGNIIRSLNASRADHDDEETAKKERIKKLKITNEYKKQFNKHQFFNSIRYQRLLNHHA